MIGPRNLPVHHMTKVSKLGETLMKRAEEREGRAPIAQLGENPNELDCNAPGPIALSNYDDSLMV